MLFQTCINTLWSWIDLLQRQVEWTCYNVKGHNTQSKAKFVLPIGLMGADYACHNPTTLGGYRPQAQSENPFREIVSFSEWLREDTFRRWR